MHPQFLGILCCPKTGQQLTLEAKETCANGMIATGKLVTPDGTAYPIIRGIPRFVSQEFYTSSFTYQWNRWPRVQFESENTGRPMAGHTTRMWETITGVDAGEVQGRTIVEFGCGPGRFLDVVRHKGGRAVGIDLSLGVEDARRNFIDDPNVLIVQGDLFNSPFRAEVFDGGFAMGVLDHTPDPRRGLTALTRTVRPGGWVALCVFPKGGFYDSPSLARFRRLQQRLQPKLGYRPALGYVYLSAYVLAPLMHAGKRIRGLARLIKYVEREWLVSLYLPDIRWRLLDTFDAITPPIATTHTGDEVREWMYNAGCRNIRTTGWCKTSVAGVKA